jgi:hypothetical protein
MSCALLLLGIGRTAAADADHVNLVPENALLGITIRNVEDLGKKGDALVDKTGWNAPDRPSRLFVMLLEFLGIKTGVDLQSAGGLVLANPREAGVEEPFTGPGMEKLPVAIVPIKDRDEMGANFGLKKGELKADTIATTKLAGILGGSLDGVLYVHGNHLYIGLNDKAVLSVAKGKPCHHLLTAQQKKSMIDADLFVFVGARAWGKEWDNVPEQIKQLLPDASHGGDEALNKQLLDSIGSLQHVFLGLNLHDEGASVKLITLLDRKNASARKIMESVQSGEGASDLSGLPEGRVIGAEAFRGNGARNVLLARALLYSLMTLPGRGPAGLISAADRTTYLGVFAELWKLLEGHRLAVYQNDREEQQGLFAAVAILDANDPEKLLQEIRQLMRLGDGKDLKLGKDGSGDDAVQMQKMIRDLGDEEFEVRATATTRLELVGQAALPFLEKALDSTDPEIRHRAEEIKKQIVASTEQRRKELLETSLPRPVRPSFTFIPGVQKLEGKPVDVIRIKLSDADAALAQRLRLLFGPDWDKLRLVIHEKQIVVLLGSEEKLLQAALVNLKEGRPGLARSTNQEAFVRHTAKGRKAELHLSLHTTAALIEARDLKDPLKTPAHPALTSLALSVDGDALQLEVWLPVEELKVILNEWKP